VHAASAINRQIANAFMRRTVSEAEGPSTSAVHHLLLFRPFAGVHGAEKLTGSYRAGKRTGWNRPIVLKKSVLQSC